MKILCVIPSRIRSTRLPRKPLLPIQGKPMVQWTYENAKRCPILMDVVVATDDAEIANVIKSINGHVIITDPHLPTGTDRVASVAKQFPDADIIINLQGDEPFIQPKMLEQLVAPYLKGETPHMATLAYPLSKEAINNPGAVKVITDINGNALYFSRAPIPFYRTHDAASVPVYHHIGLYAYQRDFLLQYPTLKQTPLELTESLEQLRAMEHGFKIRVSLTEERTLEINTPEEYEAAQHFEYIVR